MLFVTKNPLKVLQAFNPQPYTREEKTSWPLWVRGQLGVLLGSSSQGYYLGKIIIINFLKTCLNLLPLEMEWETLM